ncbi:hypothetical protein SALBM311S_10359 [Streptomyces alboniger]
MPVRTGSCTAARGPCRGRPWPGTKSVSSTGSVRSCAGPVRRDRRGVAGAGPRRPRSTAGGAAAPGRTVPRPPGGPASQRPAAPRTSPGPGGSGASARPCRTPATEVKATAFAAAPCTDSARLARKDSTVPEVSATCSARSSRRTISRASAAAAEASSVGPARSPGSPVSTRYVVMPLPRSRRRPDSSDAEFATPGEITGGRTVRLQAEERAGTSGVPRNRSGCRRASCPARAGPRMRASWASKVPRPSSVLSTPWQYWSTRDGVSIIRTLPRVGPRPTDRCPPTVALRVPNG